MALEQIQVGEQYNGDGATVVARAGKQGETIVSELHGRFYEQTYRGRVYGGGKTLTSISNATFTTATLDATHTPICGVWNPLGSGVNLVILQAMVNFVVTAATATGIGGTMWAASNGNTAISTGVIAYNRLRLTQGGSISKYLGGVAATGLTNNIVAMFGSSIGGGAIGNFNQVGTAVGFVPATTGSVENFDGSLIVPPGGVLSLLCVTTPVAHSCTSGMVWEEVPI